MPEAAAPAAAADNAAQANAGQGNEGNNNAGNNEGKPADKPWYDGHNLKDEDIGFIQNKGWKTPGDMLNGYRGLEKFHGVPSDLLLKLPKDLNDNEAMGEVYKRLGRPDTADGYEFKAPEALKDVELDQTRVKWAGGIAHKLGLNKAQYNQLVAATVEYEHGLLTEEQAKIAQEQETQMNSLKKEWGEGYVEREALGQRAVRAFLPGNQEQKEAMADAIEKAIGTAATMKLFANIGERLGEDKIHEGDTGGRKFGYTPEQAKADKESLMSELKADKKRLTAYNKGLGPDYEKMQRLNKIIAG